MNSEYIRSIENYIQRLKYKRYNTGVMHITAPEWLEDLRNLIKFTEDLLEEVKKGPPFPVA